MRKHKINSIIFLSKSEEFLFKLKQRIYEFNHFEDSVTLQFVMSETESFIEPSKLNSETLVVSFNTNTSEIYELEFIKNVTLFSPDVKLEYQTHFDLINLLGFQRHLISKPILNALNINNKRNLSLGLLRQNISNVEPILRDSDFVHFDLSSLKWSELKGTLNSYSTGWTTEEFIQLTKLVGFSDQVKIINYSNFDESEDMMVEFFSSCIWYLCESLDTQFHSSGEQISNIVHLPDTEHYITFHKIIETNKTWVSIEDGSTLPCSLEEYSIAVDQGEVSDRIIIQVSKML